LSLFLNIFPIYSCSDSSPRVNEIKEEDETGVTAPPKTSKDHYPTAICLAAVAHHAACSHAEE
jgi:hypothetical protein